MIFKSEHITQASGSVGGVTYARAKGGTLYRRARAIPVNPNSALQSQVRSAMTAAVNRWNSGLSQAWRDTWDLYAQNVTVVNKLGSATHISGQNWFVACEVPRQQAVAKLGLTIASLQDAPSQFDRGDFPTPSAPTISATTGLSMAYDDMASWVNNDDNFMLVYMGRPRNQSRQSFSGPYRLVGAIEGSLSSPPSSPFTISAVNLASLGFPLNPQSRVDVQVAVALDDGRLSSRRTIGSPIIGV